jgi:hypothetical protein
VRNNWQHDGNQKAKAKTFQIRKNKDRPIDEQRYPIRGQGQPQPSKHEGESSAVSLRQAQPDSRQ